MAKDEHGGVLAHMAYWRVAARKRALLTRIVTDNPGGDHRALFDAAWQEPEPGQLANEVAAKCQSAMEYHDREIAARPDDETLPANRAYAEALLGVAVAGGAEPGLGSPDGQMVTTPENIDVIVDALVAEGI